MTMSHICPEAECQKSPRNSDPAIPRDLLLPIPLGAPGRAQPIPMSPPRMFHRSCFCLSASQLWLGREARADPSRLCLSTEFQRTQEGAFPAAGAAHRTGTLTLFALWHGRVPHGARSAGAAGGAPQGVPRVAGEGHGVPCLVEIATRGHLPMPDKWEQAVGSWERERKEMFTCTAPRGPALMEAGCAAQCPE